MSQPASAASLLLTILVMTTAPAAHAARGQSLSLVTRFSSYYDDNLLEYSAGQIRDFELGLNPDRYAIETRDDLVFNPLVAVTWELDRGRGRRQALRIKAEGNYHARNGNADFGSGSLRWSESWSRDRRLTLSYYVLPRYYLRQLFDDDAMPAYAGLTKYRRADMSLQIASAGWTQRLTPRILLDLGYQYERRDYNHDFDERDSDLHQGEFGVSLVRLPQRGTVRLGGGYRVSHARGTDGNEAEPLPDPDISYHGLSLGLVGRMELARAGPWRLLGDLAYELETRGYDSDRPSNKYHFGRDDIGHAVEFGLRTAYRPHWSLRGFYRFRNNASTLGVTAPLSTDLGSYRVNQVGFAIEWSGDVWMQAAREPNSDEESQP